MDIEYAFFAPTPSYVYKQRNKESLIPNYKDKLLEGYADYHERALMNAVSEDEIYRKKKRAFDTKTCYCGNNLRYIESYGFWGCSAYKNKLVDHITFSGREPYISSYSVHIPATWLPEIIAREGLKGKVFAKELYEFYLSEGLEDLRIKYGKNTSENTFNGYIKAKGRSIEQEDLAEGYLQTVYKRVAVQQCIHYKLKDGKVSFCIPDFIVGDQEQVTVIDAKLDYTNDPKMDKYIELVEFILRGRKDHRSVTGAYIMYDVNEDVTHFFTTKFPIIRIPPINDFEH